MKIGTRLVVIAAAAMPGVADAKGMTPGSLFMDAAMPMKLLMGGLAVATLAALMVTIRKLSAHNLSGGSAFLSGLRLGGPMVGLLGAALTALAMSIGLSNTGQQPIEVLASAFAEAAFVTALGLLSGLVAVVCHTLVEARVDRAVLAL